MSTRKTTVWRLVAAGAACGSAAGRMWASWALFTAAAGYTAFRFLKVTNERAR